MAFNGQDNIDQWLVEHLNLPEKGIFVDVGAGPDGINMSNSKYFEDKGWTCLCIEGDSRNKKIKENRKLVELEVVSTKPEVTFYESEISPDISGVIKYNDKVKPRKVKAVTLESLLKKHKIDKIDILSIDTEGSEIDVWESMDQSRKPKYLVIEFDTQGHVNTDIEPYFIKKGYRPVAIVGPNMIFELNEVERDPHLMVYGSSYDRGLEHLLKMWPDIRKAVPDARLRIFYGWTLFDIGYSDNPERMAWKEKMNELMKQDGIQHLGRIGHEAVKKEFERAGVWAYPTHFGEISCITGMKAQAYGAIPCVIDYAAIKETVQFGVKVKGDIYDQETKDLYKNSLIALLNDDKYQEEVRKKMMPAAQARFKWQNVAIQWNTEFTRDLTDDEINSRLTYEVEKLLEDNQPLKAWDLVKDTDWPKKDRLWLRVKHAFNKEDYIKYYSQDLVEEPIREEYSTQAEKVFPRFAWLVKNIEEKKPKSVVDLGCADGYLPLTLAKRGIPSVGVNLYKPSVDLANKRAEKFKLPAKFITGDLMDYKDKHDGVVLSEVLEHVPNPQEVVDHCMSLLNEGGSFYLTTPSPSHLGIKVHKERANKSQGDWDDGSPSGHLRVFTDKDLQELLKGYTIKQMMIDEQGCYLVEVIK